MAQLHPCLSEAAADGIYLRLDASNDPVTGELILTPASGTTSLRANKDIVLLGAQKLVFDGS